uniref:helix-hairpin-helix domain-containing protein n=1 Tax=Candidatus Enterococcus willemsii TaxID=1857215 RepID=UPI00403F023A
MNFFRQISHYKQYALVGLIASVLIIGGGFFLLTPTKEEAPTWETIEEVVASSASNENEIPTTIMVDIKGEVKKPGVYEIAAEARVKEVVMLAGGFTEQAEENQLNLAEKLTDQQMIYVPNKEEAVMVAPVNVTSTSSQNVQVNINTADTNELQTLTGIGAAKAQAIIDYREENGLFKSVDDLIKVSGFGEKTVEKLREDITI